MLNLKNALRLYAVVGKHFPEDLNTISKSSVSFLRELVDKLDADEYVLCVAIICEKSVKEIITEYNSAEVLNLFVSGLAENKIVKLVEFCRSIGF